MKILLLEDNTILRESIVEFLISKNYNVSSFEDSNAAFDSIFYDKYDLLLLDVNVPGEWDGFSLKKRVN